MRFYAETVEMPPNTFKLVRDLIHERLGLFYENGKQELLADKLSGLVLDHGFNSFLDYYYFLKYDGDGSAWDRVMDALSVQETYFWREMDQINALVRTLVPQLAQSCTCFPLKIWSAACATGEEPLTIAMALNEAGWLDRVPLRILASDASPRAVAAAREGKYGKRSFRNLPEGLREKYFTPVGERWAVVPQLHSRIQYFQANLTNESEIAGPASSQVIFCRNVFIYFSTQVIGQIVEQFQKRMMPPSYLMLGASESLLKITTRFQLRMIDGAFVYVRE